jgi:hypothetical protein
LPIWACGYPAIVGCGASIRASSKDTLEQGEVITVKGYRAKAEPFVVAARMIEMPGREQLIVGRR